MGIITGTILTVIVVYVYCACSWRMIQVKKQYDTEDVYLIFSCLITGEEHHSEKDR